MTNPPPPPGAYPPPPDDQPGAYPPPPQGAYPPPGDYQPDAYPPPPGAYPPPQGAYPPPGDYQPGAYPPPPQGAYPPPGVWTGPPLASWGERVAAFLIDAVAPLAIVLVGFLLAAIVSSVSEALSGLIGILAYVGSFAFTLWNLVQQGNTGQTIGKKKMRIRLLKEADGQPVGVGLSIGRYFLHVVDGIPCYVGYLWPLWDQKRQTFADKIVRTLVVKG